MIQEVTHAICDSPIFIIGSPRSGTSALAWALHQHPLLWTSRESDLFLRLFRDDRVEKDFRAERDRPDETWLSEHAVDKPEFFRYLGLGLNALWTSRSENRRWVDQTPGNTIIVDTLADLFPGAVFLHILRDPRRTVHSMLNFSNMLSPEMAADFEKTGQLAPWMRDMGEAARLWAYFVDRAMEFAASHPDRCLTFTNESLSDDPVDGFGRIHLFLGVEDHPGPAKFFRENRVNSSFAKTAEGKPGPRSSRPWQKWSDEQKAVFMSSVLPVMQKHQIFPELRSNEFLA